MLGGWKISKYCFSPKTSVSFQPLIRTMYIDIIPVLKDNYSYLVYNQETRGEGMYLVRLL
jgi:hypothetical protein